MADGTTTFDPGSAYWHRRAELWMGRADRAKWGDDREWEARCWRMAGSLEFKALATIPPSRVRTRNIITESYLACLRRAQALERGQVMTADTGSPPQPPQAHGPGELAWSS